MSDDQKPWKKWQYSYFKAHGGNIEQWELNQVLTGSFQSLFPHWLCHTPSLCFQCIHQWVRVRFVGQNPLLNRFQICVGECTKFKENINSEVQSHQMPAVFAISEIKLVVIISFSFVKYSVDVMGSLNILISYLWRYRNITNWQLFHQIRNLDCTKWSLINNILKHTRFLYARKKKTWLLTCSTSTLIWCSIRFYQHAPKKIQNLCSTQYLCEYNLRGQAPSTLDQKVPIYKSRAASNSFSAIAPKRWNNTITDLIKIDQKALFKRQLKKSLLNEYAHKSDCTNPRCKDKKHHS